jgi:hypothetical protein
MWSMRVRVSGVIDAGIAVMNRLASSRILVLVSCERQTRISKAQHTFGSFNDGAGVVDFG